MPPTATQRRRRVRRRPPRSRTRAELLEAAVRVFKRSGVAAASIEEICDEAGFTRGAFYSNFSDKDDILLAVVESDMSSLLDELRQRLDTRPSLDEFVAAISGPASPEWSRREDQMLANEMHVRAQTNPALRAKLLEFFEMVRDGLADGLDAVYADLPLPSRDLALLIVALANGLVRYGLLDETVDADGLFDAWGLPLLLRGLESCGGELRPT